MTQTHVLIGTLLAALAVGASTAVLIARFGWDDGVRRLKLFGNVALLAVLYVPAAICLGLLFYAAWTGRWGFGLLGLVVLGIGVAIFRSADFRHRRPITDYLSGTAMRDSVSRLRRETRELRRTTPPDDQPPSPVRSEPDGAGEESSGIADFAASDDVRTFRVSFRFGTRRRRSGPDD